MSNAVGRRRRDDRRGRVAADDAQIPLSAVGIEVRPLEAPRQSGPMSHWPRRLLADADNAELASVLRACDLPRVSSVQEEIVESELLPLF
jgi:hypothetical protein